jgi:hypothetical protein
VYDGQAAAHLVEHVRPHVAVVVDGLDDLDLPHHRVALGDRVRALGDHRGVARESCTARCSRSASSVALRDCAV